MLKTTYNQSFYLNILSLMTGMWNIYRLPVCDVLLTSATAYHGCGEPGHPQLRRHPPRVLQGTRLDIRTCLKAFLIYWNI